MRHMQDSNSWPLCYVFLDKLNKLVEMHVKQQRAETVTLKDTVTDVNEEVLNSRVVVEIAKSAMEMYNVSLKTMEMVLSGKRKEESLTCVGRMLPCQTCRLLE